MKNTGHKENSQPQILWESIVPETDAVSIANYIKKSGVISGRSLSRYFFKGLVRLNGRKAHSHALVKTGDRIRVFALEREYQPLEAEDLPLAMVYEDNRLLVVNKPALMAIHPVKGITSGTLAHRVASHLERSGRAVKVRPVNRLDFGTSGLVIFAKSGPVQTELSMAIQNHQVRRIYYGIVNGGPREMTGTIHLPLGEKNGHWVVDSKGKPAVTHYHVRERFKGASLLELELETGRTHQIRAHLSAIGSPILGDHRYGTGGFGPIKRPALHAGKLFFPPEMGIPGLIAEMPEDMRELLVFLRKRE